MGSLVGVWVDWLTCSRCGDGCSVSFEYGNGIKFTDCAVYVA